MSGRLGRIARRSSWLSAWLVLDALLPGGRNLLRKHVPVVEEELSEMQATLFRPAGETSAPGVVMVTGALLEGRNYPPMRAAATAFAGAGCLVLVPELGRLRELVLDAGAVDDLVRAVGLLASRPETRGRRIGLYGFSLGGGLALVAAARPEIRQRIAVVASLGGYFDVLEVAVLALTNATARTTVYTTAASLVATVEAPADREILENALAGAPAAAPLAPFDGLDANRLSDEGRRVLEVLRCRDSDQLPALVRNLPGKVRDDLSRVSPSSTIDSVEAPVWLLHDKGDPYVPIQQTVEIASALAGRVPVHFRSTTLLDHTEPIRAATAAPEVLHLVGYLAGTLRVLRAADRSVDLDRLA